jgi:hypothetical protein
VQQPTHSLEEERQYCELAHRLIDAVDGPTRAAVAAKLFAYRAAPHEILRRLRPDAIVIREMAASGPEGRYPAAVANVGPDLAATEAAELSALFAAAPSDERRLILLTLDVALPRPRDELRAAPSAIAGLETLALQRRTEEFVKGLGRLLAVSDAQARRIVQDSRGETVLVAAKALGMPSDVLQRVLLFLNPAIGHSVARVYDLAQLYDEASLAAAHALVSIWQAAHPRPKRPTNPIPVHRHVRSEPVRPTARAAEHRNAWPPARRDRTEAR